ncbi:uncharacterized protein LOC132180578 [Corylus avellana]|uniref:uncharacterized protein LOC132180578 n=1 Tax=Corylus avellana TaxID=13451 RepID=UPI00286C6833|nr:uncharacterized protein LOC132180578 [Corylus avellana]
MACPPARDSIAEAAEECKELVIHILPDIPLEPSEWPECCIYRVPEQLCKVNGEAYTPKLVSIGPFHHGNDELKDMEKHKQRYLMDFLFRTQKSQKDLNDTDKILLALLKIIEDNEIKIRHCYSEDCSLNSKDFVKMILLDAIFIIELFLKDKEKKGDYISSQPWLRHGILHDLILLENQLPFFVLEKLYMFAFNDSSVCNHCKEGKQIEEHKEDLKNEDAPFVRLSRNYFGCYDKDKDKEPKSIIPIGEEVKHFTDLLRYLLCPPNMEEYWKRKMKRWTSEEEFLHSSKKTKTTKSGTQFCATKLDDAGLKFKVKYNGRLLGITLPGCLGCFPCFGLSCLCACLPCLICFPSLTCLLGCFGFPMHIFKVPQLVIDHDTEAIFRNLMALEQCLYPSKTYICSYLLLLDGLIDTEKDVDLLVDKKIIVNHFSNNGDVAALINKLGYQIGITKSSYFSRISEKLNEHYEFTLNHFLATLRREYFTNIFRGTATVVGLIILGFTFWSFLRPFVVEN